MANNIDQFYDGKAEFGYSWLNGAYPEGMAPISCLTNVSDATSGAIHGLIERGQIKAERRMLGRESVLFIDWRKALEFFQSRPAKVK